MGCSGTVLILTLFCLTSFVQDARGCSCFQLSNYQTYCKAEFAVKVKVLRQTASSPPALRVYRIITGLQKLGTLKGNVTNVDLKRVYTPMDDATCGVTLEQGKIYLLTGHVDTSKSPNRLRIGLCDWIQTWKTLSLADKNFVKKGYLTRCHALMLNSVGDE